VRFVKASKIVTFKTGKLDSNAAVEGGKYPFFTCSQTTYAINTYAFDTECVLLAGNNASAIFPLKYYKGKFNAYQRTYVIEPIDTKQLDIKYFYFFLRPFLKSFEQQATGATTKFLTIKILNNIDVLLPSIGIQQKIAAVLSAYDDLIENNKRRIALLEKMAEEIFREWFVRLRFPGYEKVKVVKGVPEGWEQKRFSDFCTLQRGYDLPDSQVEPGPYPVVASTSIKTYHKHFKVKPPVITTGRSGSLGTVLFVNENAWPLNTSLYVKNYHGNSCYLVYYTLKNMGLENFNAGAGVPSLNRNHLSGITLAVPPKPLQDRFDTVIAPMFQQKELLVKANNNLRGTRDSLLPRLISGKLPVENLDIQFLPSMI
jgi:type I restriction enzyme S subunit